MTTRFYGEGNIGSDPECKTFPPVSGKPPKALIKLNIKFDNPVPDGQGGFKAPAKPPKTKKCPDCASDMRQKKGTFGPFWGCSNYPECKTTIK